MLTSIRTRFTIITVLLVAIPLLLVSSALTNRYGTVISNLSEQRLELIADKIQLELTLFFDSELEQLNYYLAVNDSQSDVGLQNLETLLFRSNVMENVSVITPFGQEVARFSRTEVVAEYELRDLSNHPAFMTLMDGADIFYSEVRFDDTPYIMVAVPDIDVYTEAIESIILMRYDLSAFVETIDATDLSDEIEIYVVARDTGLVVAHYDPSIVLRQTYLDSMPSGTVQGDGLRPDVLMSAHQLDRMDGQLLVIIEQPLANALALQGQMVRLSVWVVLTALGIAVVVIVSMMRQMLSPIQQLVKAATRIGDGDLSTRASIKSPDEIGLLAQSFNSMATELQSLVTELEQRIAERTSALHQTNVQLRESEQRYRVISDMSMSFAFSYTFDDDGRPVIEWATDAFRRITGYHMTDYSFGEIIRTYIHADDRERLLSCGQQLTEAPMTTATEARLFAHDGAIRHIYMHLKSVFDDTGNVARIIGAAHDVTQVKHFEESLRQERNFLQSIMHTSPSGIMVIDTTGHIIFANPQSEHILGAVHQTILSRRFDAPEWHAMDFDGRPLPSDEMPYRKVMISEQPIENSEVMIERENGEQAYLSVNAVPMLDDDGHIKQVVLAVSDVTLSQQWRQKIQEALVVEKDLNQVRSRFISLISHELRTPLAIILTSTQLIQRHIEKLSQDDILTRMGKIQKQIERLRHIMNDVSFINKTDKIGHHLNVSTVDLKEIINESYSELTLTMDTTPALTLNWNDDAPDLITTDEALIHQILGNLLSNAIKYIGVDGQITVTVTTYDAGIELIIADSGIGIPEADQARLFESFHRASNVSTIQGTGLGLVIVKRAVDFLGGTITMHSEVDVGTTFTIRLPQPPDQS